LWRLIIASFSQAAIHHPVTTPGISLRRARAGDTLRAHFLGRGHPRNQANDRVYFNRVSAPTRGFHGNPYDITRSNLPA